MVDYTDKSFINLPTTSGNNNGQRIVFKDTNNVPFDNCFAMETVFVLTNPGQIYNGSTYEDFGTQTFVLFSYGDPIDSDCLNLVIAPTNPGVTYTLRVMYKKRTLVNGSYTDVYNRIELTGVTIDLNTRYYVHMMHNNLGLFVEIKPITLVISPPSLVYILNSSTTPAVPVPFNFGTSTQGGVGCMHYNSTVQRGKFRYSFGPYAPTVAQGLYLTLTRFWIPNEKWYTLINPGGTRYSVQQIKDLDPSQGYQSVADYLYTIAFSACTTSTTNKTPSYTQITPNTDPYLWGYYYTNRKIGDTTVYDHYSMYLLFQYDSVYMPSSTSISNVPNTAAYPSPVYPIYIPATSLPGLSVFGVNPALNVAKSPNVPF